MKIYICADIEGVAGVTSQEQCTPGNGEYERARRLMTAEVNAAIAGAFEGGATEVIVADSHYRFTNLIAETVDERALLIQGRPRPGVMCPGLDGSFAGLFFVGHHAGAGRHGVIAHSFSSSVVASLRLNGIECSEPMLHGAQAGALGVPVALLTGDDQLMAQCVPCFPGVVVAEVKQALAARSARSLAPARAQALVRARAAEAVRGLAGMQPFVIAPPIRFEFVLKDMVMADMVALIPAAQRMDPTTLAFSCQSMDEVLGWLMVALTLAHAAIR